MVIVREKQTRQLERNRQINKQANRRIDRLTDTQTGRLADRQKGRHSYKDRNVKWPTIVKEPDTTACDC